MRMYITVHLSDGRKITKDMSRLRFFNPIDLKTPGLVVPEGMIAVSWLHVVDVRPAEQDEIAHAEIHGY